MKYLLVFIGILAFAYADGGLRVRFDVGLGIGEDFFYDIPRSVQDALNQSWRPILRPAGPLRSLSLYCPLGDRALCAFYDDTGYIAGVQIAFEQDKFVAVFDWEIQGYTSWTTPDDRRSYWTIQQYFVDDAFLARSVEDRILSRDLTKTLQLDGIWTVGTNRQLLKIATAEEGIRNSIFTEQACIPWMGLHYYHNMSATTQCTSEGMYPWFPLVDSGALIGTGLVVFGTLSHDDGGRDWFERPQRMEVEMIVPRGPECMYALTANPGLVTMHIYYIDQPWLLAC